MDGDIALCSCWVSQDKSHMKKRSPEPPLAGKWSSPAPNDIKVWISSYLIHLFLPRSVAELAQRAEKSISDAVAGSTRSEGIFLV